MSNEVLEETYFFAKEKNFQLAIAKFFARNGHIIMMDINSELVLSLQKIATVLKNGKKMTIFPEGARSRDGKLQPFKKTFAILAHELNIPVVPVCIKGTYETLPINTSIPKKSNVSVEFLPPVSAKGKSVQEIADETHRAIEACLEPN